MTAVMDRPDTIVRNTDHLDNNKITHIIRKKDEMPGYFEGKEITALCGEKFIPTRDPEQFPPCEPCIAELARIRASRA